MDDSQPVIVFRPFESSDAQACFAMRYEAFTRMFRQELSPHAVELGAKAYNSAEFGRMIGAMDSFVAVVDDQPVAFCTLRLLGESTAEILFLYVKLGSVKCGIGTGLVRYVEKWVAGHYPNISRLILDTAVPKYNQRFWEKVGYSKMKESVCRYPDGEIPAVRMGKSMDAVAVED
ncbi:MAG: GNAT family N-acetyltransferase [Gemmatimonadota bacterium]|nr:MAG: GNAT family N-acetyltransferase [Gemmatimonadota bacterium]